MAVLEDFVFWFLKKCFGKIFFPKDQEFLKKAENKKVLYKNNLFLININGKEGIADINNLPSELIEIIKKNFDNGEINTSCPKIEIIDHKFYQKVSPFSDFYNKGNFQLSKVKPFLNIEFDSILTLSEYIKNLLNNANHKSAKIFKDDLSSEYGTRGRKLCNLYLRGYINRLFEEYAKDLIDSQELSINQKSDKINKLLERVIANSDSIFFIHELIDTEKVYSEIAKKISLNTSFIAMHGGGKTNVNKINSILKKLEFEPNFKYYQIKVNKCLEKKSKCNLIDVYIQKSG